MTRLASQQLSEVGISTRSSVRVTAKRMTRVLPAWCHLIEVGW